MPGMLVSALGDWLDEGWDCPHETLQSKIATDNEIK
jgi:hypothetical protein